MMPSSVTCNNCGAANQPQAAYCRSCGHSLQVAKPTIYHSATGQLLANVTLKQRYRIITPVGKGGMGAVYKAEDIQLGNRLIALKEMSQSGLSPQEQKEAADAFRQEALMLARLQHPNLPNIFDHFEENGRWYLVMSFIEGETLEDYVSHVQSRKLPLDEVLQIGIQLCTVLGYLHNQQTAIIFRDLKPTNIMRTSDGHIYLIDFGIARHFKPGQAKDTAYYGSMGYAPPEQYGKAQTTPRSDIYSLGATLYQLMSGRHPSSSPFRFPPLQSLLPTAPTSLTTLITRMLELDEDKRPASTLLIKQELQALSAPVAQKQNLQNPAPNAASVAPTQPANPSVLMAPAPSVVRSVNVWTFGKKHIVTMLILAGCYSIISYILTFLLINNSYGLIGYSLKFSFLLLLPIFFGSFFGPWVGIGATGIGLFLAYFRRGLEYGFLIRVWGLDWWDTLVLMFVAFFAGLFLLKTKGQYHKFGNLLFASLLGLLDICFALIAIDSIYALVDKSNFFDIFFTHIWTLSLPVIILLPLLLLMSNTIRNVWSHRNIQKHP